jgi:hypothetical protein
MYLEGFSVALHARGGVDGVAEEAIPRHGQSHDSCHDGSYNPRSVTSDLQNRDQTCVDPDPELEDFVRAMRYGMVLHRGK